MALTEAKIALEAATREAKMLDEDLARFQRSHDDGEALMADFAAIRQQYVEVTKKIAEQQAELTGWQSQLSGVQMSLAAEVAKKRTHLKAVQAAQEQFLPSFPALPLVLGFSIGGALAFGIGLVFLANMFDRTISTTDGLAEEFGVPVHGVIGEIVLPKQRRRRRLVSCGVAVVLVFAMACVAGAGMSIFLKLQLPPERYTQWHAAPGTFLYQTAVQPVVQWITRLF
jgi:hypothetical protein